MRFDDDLLFPNGLVTADTENISAQGVAGNNAIAMALGAADIFATTNLLNHYYIRHLLNPHKIFIRINLYFLSILSV